MKFLWPDALWLVAVVPLLAVLYWKRKPVRIPAGLATAQVSDRRLHLPAALFLLGVAALAVSIARPTALLTLPSQTRTIMLAIDVSLSMRATDVQPNRLAAAQDAARGFVAEQPSDVRIGIVSFAGTASVVQQPTRERDELIAAIDRLQLDRHTAIGSGILVSLATLFPEDGITVESFGPAGRIPEKKSAKADAKPLKPVPPGSNPSAAIILLTDGRRTIGPDPLQAARLAADRGVRVYTVGFGSPQGGPVAMEGYSIYMMFDEETLKAIAGLTQAEYFHAASAAELKKVYEAVTTRFILQREQTEITAFFALAAAALIGAGAALSLAWFNRIL